MSDQNDPYFIPLTPEQPLDTPKSITDSLHERFLNEPELAAKPLRFLTKAIYALFALVSSLVLWQTVQLALFLYQQHWVLAVVFAVLLLVVMVTVVRAAVEFFLYQRDFHRIGELQEQARQCRDQRTAILKNRWLGQLRALYQDKPQQVLLEQALANVPDYNDDRELLAHLDTHFVHQLDQQALARIAYHSQQVALVVSLSPFAALDMLLSLWRSVRMLDEICQIYGVRPSFPARAHLLRLVFEQMTLAGATDLLADHLADQVADFTSNRLLGVVSSQVASGVGVAVYSARIGLRAMSLCRPIPPTEDQKPGMRRLVKSIFSALEAQLRTGSKVNATGR